MKRGPREGLEEDVHADCEEEARESHRFELTVVDIEDNGQKLEGIDVRDMVEVKLKECLQLLRRT